MKRKKQIEKAEKKIFDIVNADSSVAKEMLTQFPEFNIEAKQVLDYYKVTFESVKECQRAACIGHLLTIKGLYSLLENEELTFDQKMLIISEMKDLSKNVAEINKSFADKIRDYWKDVLTIICICILGGIGFRAENKKKRNSNIN